MGVFVFYPQFAKGETFYSCINSVADWKDAEIEKNTNYKYLIDPKFPVRERLFIEKALKLAVDRIQDKKVWEEVNKSYGYAYPKTNTISNAGFCNNVNIKKNLLFHQLYSLSLSSAKKTKAKFPKIYIYYSNVPPKERERGWVGLAYYNKVSVYWDSATRKWKNKGSF